MVHHLIGVCILIIEIVVIFLYILFINKLFILKQMKKFNFLEKIKENNFLIVGRAGIDIYPDPPGTKTEIATNFVSHLGGSSANIAVSLTKLGGK